MHLVHWDPFEDMRRRAWTPAVDIFEKGDDLVIRAEVPGIERDAIDVKVENNTLILSGERKSDLERSCGSFVRRFTLPKTVDATRITATYKAGVLDISIPKAEEAKPRTIEIKVA